MNCCSLGVNAFRPSIQIAAQQLSSPSWSRFAQTVVAPSVRFFSIWPSGSGQQQTRRRCSGGPRPWASLAPRKPPLPICRNVRALTTSKHAIITRYIDVPATYTDETGLPFRRDDLSPTEVLKLFGSHMSTGAGNRLLRILHGRRVAGTLEEPELQVNTAMYSDKEIKIALSYLRRTVQVDEITNAGLRAEDELAALEAGEEFDRDTGKLPEWLVKRFGDKMYKTTTTTDEGRGVYEKGVFDAIREKNRLKWEARLKQQEEEEKRRKEEEEAGIQSGELVRVSDRAVGGVIRKPSPQMQKWVDKAQSDLEAPPEMSKWERILPSAVVVGIFTCLLVAYAAYYRPLKRSDRLWPDIPPAAATVGAIVLANLAVYAAWKIPPFWGVLNRYFILVAATPRALSVLGAGISHQKFTHLMANMFVLWIVGTHLYDDVGRGNFLAIYFGGSALGFLGSLSHLVLTNRLQYTALGASGGVYAVMGAYFWRYRFDGFKLFGLPPDPFNGVPGVAFIGLLTGLNIAAMFSRGHKIDVTSHLVGLGTGVLAAQVLEARRKAARLRLEKKNTVADGGRKN
ncbi:rhomboid protein 1, mitochondrial [Echria macrotheca]|uniref:Rhomboid protein 1, mitochondrial n=1 Tax=Echria macrotheca TaxID=438768 RepID=A0AAJ0FDC0_9PEZI|nr:rhomboid protein 1, mitochondrial [Echria macrotheca]